MVQACQPMRLRTGTVPSVSPIDSRRTDTSTRIAKVAPAAITAGTSQSAAPANASTRVVRPTMPRAMTRPPTAKATSGNRASASPEAAYAQSHRCGAGARPSGQCVVEVPPTRSAGDPAHVWSARTRPNTADPGAISARRPMRVPGASVLRAPTVASAPIRMPPMRTTSPSIQ